MNLYYELRSSRYRKPLRASIVIVMLLVSAFVVTLTVVNVRQGVAEIPPSAETYFWVSPENSTATDGDGDSFTIGINITNAPSSGINSYEVSVSWDTAVLNVTGATKGDFFYPSNATDAYYGSLTLANIAGKITIAQSLHGENETGGAGWGGNGWLCDVTFQVISVGSCVLDLQDTTLGIFASADKVYVEYPNRDGFFRESTETVSDVAVNSVALNDTVVDPGDVVQIDVTVTNEGNSSETVTLNVYADVEIYDSADPDVVMVGDELTVAPSQAFNLGATASVEKTFYWGTLGNASETYYISANASIASDDDMHDNVLIDGTVKIEVTSDIKVTGLAAVPDEVFRREVVDIVVDLENQGTAAKTFDLVVYANYSLANQTHIDTITGISLGSGATTTKTVQWDTTWAANGRYTINATVPPVVNERDVDKADNTRTAPLRVRPVHDIAVPTIAVVTTLPVNVSDTAIFRIYIYNLGTENETFDLHVYADALGIYHTTGLFLENNTFMIHYVYWDTTGTLQGDPLDLIYMPSEGTYYLSAHVPPVFEETADIGNNYVSMGTIDINVFYPGDCDFDGHVDSYDMYLLTKDYPC